MEGTRLLLSPLCLDLPPSPSLATSNRALADCPRSLKSCHQKHTPPEGKFSVWLFYTSAGTQIGIGKTHLPSNPAKDKGPSHRGPHHRPHHGPHLQPPAPRSMASTKPEVPGGHASRQMPPPTLGVSVKPGILCSQSQAQNPTSVLPFIPRPHSSIKPVRSSQPVFSAVSIPFPNESSFSTCQLHRHHPVMET